MTAAPHLPAVHRIGRPGLTWRETGGEIVILDVATSVYYGLNRTATTLWPHLAAGATREDLQAALRASTGVDAESGAADVDGFLALVHHHGLLQEDEPRDH